MLNGNAWGIQNDASWETCFIIISIEPNCSGKYKENINRLAREMWLVTAHRLRLFELHSTLFIEV